MALNASHLASFDMQAVKEATMQEKGGESVNKGPGPKTERERNLDTTGNARRRGEDPSPDDRERGETSSKEREPPVEI
jgi:hypothetical protein